MVFGMLSCGIWNELEIWIKDLLCARSEGGKGEEGELFGFRLFVWVKLLCLPPSTTARVWMKHIPHTSAQLSKRTYKQVR